MSEIVFENARITAVEHRIAKAGVTSRIKVVAQLTSAIAAAIEARWLLYDNAPPGYTAVELDYEIKGVTVRFVAPKLDTPLNLTSELASHFKVFQQGDGENKPKKLMVSFRIKHAGSPFELLEYLIRVGGIEGTCTLTPLQQELFDEKEEKAKAENPFIREGVHP